MREKHVCVERVRITRDVVSCECSRKGIRALVLHTIVIDPPELVGTGLSAISPSLTRPVARVYSC